MVLIVWTTLGLGTIFSEERVQPLLQLKCPLPWSVEGLDPKLGSRFKTLILSSLSNTGSPLLRARSKVMASIQGSPTLELSEPPNLLLPIPEVVLYFPSHDPAVLRASLQSWVKREIEAWLGVQAPWLAFSPVGGKRNVLEAFVMAGRIWLIEREGGCELLFSSRSSFLSDHLKKTKEKIGGDEGHLGLQLQIGRSMEIYYPWLEGLSGGKAFGALGELLKSWEQLEIHSSGAGEDMSWTIRLQTSSQDDSLESPQWYASASVPDLKGEPFFQGGVTFFPGLGDSLAGLISDDFLGAEREVLDLLKIFLVHLESFAFSQSKSSIAPVVSMRVSDMKAFKDDLGQWAMSGRGRFGLDPQTKEIHLQWGQTTLSVREFGRHLIMSPLRQVVEDALLGLTPALKKEGLWFHLPLEGDVDQVYYSAFMSGLALSEFWGGPVDPNIMPSFSRTGLVNRSWKRPFDLRLKGKSGVWEFDVNSPFGPLGVTSGLELQTSTLVYVLSWYNLSRNSWKGR